ncbi:ATP-dependent helicase [Psychromonas sp. SP041]|uniref:ATP-dependent helicase n=1 Tax=Psychromonas sp. SP041 TaxID=1365007 RepID=UPI001484FF83|nr:ATP-dependent helicase [Psychromonas sp. SP041]
MEKNERDNMGNAVTSKKKFNPQTATAEEVRAALDELNKPLNPEQKVAAETTEGAVMVVAGAGAGKTKTVIHRVASLMIKNVYAGNILVMTFTNQAASEIKERLEGMIGENGQYVHAGTFHSIIFRELLKAFPEHPYFEKHGINMQECVILDEKDAESILKDAINELSEEDAEILNDQEFKVKQVLSVMSKERASGRNSSDFRRTIEPGSRTEITDRIVFQIWDNYTKKCSEMQGLDFDDILVHADRLLKSDKGLSEELSRKFQYIMLDEYQDTNPVQMSIMDSIAINHGNICVVGDEKQSIYGFRFADINVILSFDKRYKNVKLVNMNKNYRSYPNVIKYANGLADAMPRKLSDGQLDAQRPIQESRDEVLLRKSNSVAMVEFPSEELEAEAVMKAIKRDLNQFKMTGSDIAVLYRNRNLKNVLERELVQADIPYNIIGDRSFFQRAEVRDAVAMVRFVFNPWDSMAGFRLLKATSMKISDQAAKKAMREEGVNVHEFLKQQSNKKLKAKKRGETEPDYTSSAKKAGPFIKLAEMIRKSAEYQDSPEFISDALARIWDIYLGQNLLKKADKEGGAKVDNRVENVRYIFKKVKDSLTEGMSIGEIIEDLTMMVDNNSANDVDDRNKVQLMTMHASKGLEYKNVYVIGLDNQTTHGENMPPEEIEESRRLIYVAMTRAEKKLSMSYSCSRTHNGKRVNVHQSPFFDEIQERTLSSTFVVPDPYYNKVSSPSFS